MSALGGASQMNFFLKIPIKFSKYSETSTNGERHIQSTPSHTLKTRDIKICFRKT